MTEMDLADLLGVKRRAPLCQQIYQSIWEAVVSGNIVPRTLLTEPGVAELLRVSRTPVREALKQLVGVEGACRQALLPSSSCARSPGSMSV